MVRRRPDLSDQDVANLVAARFPEFADLAVRRIAPGGWDNLSYRLGEDMLVRLPSAECYAPQIAREAQAFAALAGTLPCAIPHRVRTGVGDGRFPFDWAINGWVKGAPATVADANTVAFAEQCGAFLADLHARPAGEGPRPGGDNFHRGGPLPVYAPEVARALRLIAEPTLRSRLAAVWALAVGSVWAGQPRWVHGDFFLGNLLQDRTGRLSGVIDWGLTAGGDPACDLAMAWTSLESGPRLAFRRAARVDPFTWRRARGWSLWKATTLMTGVNPGTPQDVANSVAVVSRICADDD